MSGCLLAGALLVALGPGGDFTLEWAHSVEKTRWRESWQVTPTGLRLIEAAVQGAGAGMEQGANGHAKDGWWVWQPELPAVPQLALAASGMTGSGWRLCGEQCQMLGADAAAPLILRPCPKD